MPSELETLRQQVEAEKQKQELARLRAAVADEKRKQKESGEVAELKAALAKERARRAPPAEEPPKKKKKARRGARKSSSKEPAAATAAAPPAAAATAAAVVASLPVAPATTTTAASIVGALPVSPVAPRASTPAAPEAKPPQATPATTPQLGAWPRSPRRRRRASATARRWRASTRSPPRRRPRGCGRGPTARGARTCRRRWPSTARCASPRTRPRARSTARPSSASPSSTRRGSTRAAAAAAGAHDDVVLDSLVKPSLPIKDAVERVHGIKASDLDGVAFTLAHAQAALAQLCSDRTVLIGHAVANDLEALRFRHGCIVDTSVAYGVVGAAAGVAPSLRDVAAAVLPPAQDAVNKSATHDSPASTRGRPRCAPTT